MNVADSMDSEFPGVLAYCMLKAAIDQFTRCTALGLASKNVRVNAVCPGVIVTDIHKRAGMDEQAYSQFLEHCWSTHALGRLGEVQEVAQAIAFLASNSASFITGATLWRAARHVSTMITTKTHGLKK